MVTNKYKGDIDMISALILFITQNNCVVTKSVHTPAMKGQWKFLGVGRGVVKANFLEEEYEAKMEFPDGGE